MSEEIHGSLSGATTSLDKLVPDVPGSKELTAQRTQGEGLKGEGSKGPQGLEIQHDQVSQFYPDRLSLSTESPTS